MLRLLQISDLHFGPPFIPQVATALSHEIARLAPDVLVVSGDLTQRAKRKQFAQARHYFNQLPPIPKIIVPGNHDVPLYRIWERLTQPYALYEQYIGSPQDSVLRRNGTIIVALNSYHPLRAITNGRIRSRQLAFCARAFTNAPLNAARIIVAHHHFAPGPDYQGSEVMPKAKRALDAFTRLKVDLIMTGHLHRAYVGSSLDAYSGKDREHGIVIVQCGTSTSRRGRMQEREKNSFNWIEISELSIRVVHYMHFSNTNMGFRPVSQYKFARRKPTSESHEPTGN